MRNLQELNIFNDVKVKLNEKGLEYLKKSHSDFYNLNLDGYIQCPLWSFFNIFSNCSTGFDFLIYKIDNEYFRIYNDTTVDVKLTDLGMTLFYDIALDGIIKNPSSIINISIKELMSTLGKYITKDQELPINNNFLLNVKHIPKVKLLKR